MSEYIKASAQIATFELDYSYFLVAARLQLIDIVASERFTLITTLKGHQEPVQSLSVCPMNLDIVSVSRGGRLIVHQFQKRKVIEPEEPQDKHKQRGDPSEYQLLHLSEMRWSIAFQKDLNLDFHRCEQIHFSMDGDILLERGEDYFSVWMKNDFFDNQFDPYLYYSSRPEFQKMELLPPKDLFPAQYVCYTKGLENLVQSELAINGRLFGILQKGADSVQVWINSHYFDGQGHILEHRQKYMNKEEVYLKKDKEMLEFGGGSSEDDQIQKHQSLAKFRLIHESKIEEFKIKNENYYEVRTKLIPTTFITLTTEGEIYIWVENFKNNVIDFYLLEVIDPFQRVSHLQNLPHFCFLEHLEKKGNFLKRSRYLNNLRVYREQKQNYYLKGEDMPVQERKKFFSPLLHHQVDTILQHHKHRRELEITVQNYDSSSLDWLYVIQGGVGIVYRVSGLRNYPLSSVSIQIHMKLSYVDEYVKHSPALTPKILLRATCKEFSNNLTVLSFTQDLHIVKLRKNMKRQAQQFKLNDVWLLNRQAKIEAVECHTQAGLVAIIASHSKETKTNRVWIYSVEGDGQLMKSFPIRFNWVFRFEKEKAVKIRWHPHKIQLLMISESSKVNIIEPRYNDEFHSSSQSYQEWFSLFKIQLANRKLLDGQFVGNEELMLWGDTYAVRANMYSNFTKFISLPYDQLYSVLALGNTASLHLINENQITFNSLLQPGQVILKKEIKFPVAVAKVDYHEGTSRKLVAVLLKSHYLKFYSFDGQYMGFVHLLRMNLKKKSETDSARVTLFEVLEQKDDSPESHSSEFTFLKTQVNVSEISLITIVDGNISLLKQSAEYSNQRLNMMQFDKVAILKPSQYIDQYLKVKDDAPPLKCKIDCADNTLIFTVNEEVLLFEKKFKVLKEEPEKEKEEEKKQKKHKDQDDVLAFVLGQIENIDDGNEVKQEEITKEKLDDVICKAENVKPLFHPQVLTELIANGDTFKVYKILNLLHNILKTYSGKEIRALLNIDMQILLHQKRQIITEPAAATKAPSKVQKKKTEVLGDDSESSSDDGGLLEDILGGGGVEQESESEDESSILQESTAAVNKLPDPSPLKFMAKEDSFLISEEEEQKEKEAFVAVGQQCVELIQKCKLPAMEVVNKAALIRIVELMIEFEERAKTKDQIADILLRSHWLARLNSKSDHPLIAGKPWSTYEITLALHSNDQDAILKEILPERGEEQIDWATFQHYSIPLWFKNPIKLADLTNTLANNEFNLKNAPAGKDVAPDQANHVAIWFIALNKLSKLAKFYQIENNDKLAKFMVSDFSKTKVIRQSERNAFILKGQKRYTLSAGFFILGNKLDDAIHVLLRDQKDINLAVLVSRLVEGQNSKTMAQIYESQFINKAADLRDIWLHSIGNWQTKQYIEAVNSLASAAIFEVNREEEVEEEELDEYNLMTGEAERQSELWQYKYPILSLPKPTVGTVVNKMKGHYLVVNEQQSQSSSFSSGGSIFDAFHGSSEQKEEVKEKPKKKELVIKLEQFEEINAQDFLNRGLPYFALRGTPTTVIAAEELVQTLVRDVYDKYGAQSLKEEVSKLVDTIVKKYETPRAQLYERARLEFARKNQNIGSYLIRTLYQSRSMILSSMLVDVASYHQRMLFAYPFALDNPKKLIKKYKELMSQLVQRLNALMVISARSGKLMSSGFSPHPTQKSSNNSFDNEFSPEGSKVPSEFPDDSGSYDHLQFSEEDNFQAGQQLKLDTLRQHLYFWLHVVIFELSVSFKCFSSSVAILINLSAMLDSQNFQIAHIEALHMSLKEIQATLAIREQNIDEDITEPESAEINPRKCLTFIHLFLQDVCVRNLLNVFQHSLLKKSTTEAKLLQFRGDILQREVRENGLSHIASEADLILSRDKLLKGFDHLQRKLAFVKSMFNLKEINFTERSEIARSLHKFFIENAFIKASRYFDISLLFKEKSEVRRFTEAFNMKQHLARLSRSRFKMVSYDGSSQSLSECINLYSNGVEIFRMKGEQVAGFTINSCHERNMAIALPHRGSREINIQHTLLFRNRKAEEQGLKIMDDQVKTWEQCLHRYDNLVESHRHGDFTPPFPAIVGANDKLYPPYFNIRQIFPLKEQRPVELFRNKPSLLYLKYRKKKAASHDQLAYSIADHPYLTLYITGNGQSQINMWVYESFDDSSIDHFYATSSLVSNSKKSVIQKLRFNWYGDKFGALDNSQNFFMFNIDLSPACSYPYLNLDRHEIGHAINDFAFFNQSSLLATCASKPKPIFCLYDLLMPKLEPALKVPNHGGDMMQLLPKQQKVIMMNERKGYASFVDLRKPGTPIFTKQLHHDKITASGQFKQKLVTGSDAGIVKIWNMENEAVDLVEKIDAFQMRPQEVSDIQITRDGALFASSQNGAIKILRTQL